MPLIDGGEFSIPANGSLNVFLGQPMEFLGGNAPSVVRLLLNADARGLTAAWSMNVGGTQTNPINPGVTINVAEAAGQGPNDDEDTVASQQVVPVGARNALKITNSTGAAVLARYRAIILP